MGTKQEFSLDQQQLQKLALTQSMRQSIQMLQYDVIDLTNYLTDLSLNNPLIEVRSHLDSILVGTPGNYQIEDDHQSLFDYLLEQVHLTMRKTPLRDLVVYLIEQLDPTGYLLVADAQLQAELGISSVMLLDAKTLLQQLDPPGVGAHDLQECLLLQAQQDPETIPAAVIPSRKHYSYLGSEDQSYHHLVQ